MTAVPTAEEIDTWPVTVQVPQAGLTLQLGRDAAYEAARRGELPGAIRIGRRWVVVTAHLRAALGIDDQPSGGGGSALPDAGARAMAGPQKPQYRNGGTDPGADRAAAPSTRNTS